ncbi:MAG: UDP-N-acetylglucosamine 2-epimerase (non-hydrolyzing) [Fimbriimonadaceae bacterium]
MDKPVVVCVVGTRPDAIKSAPVVLELRRFSELADTVLVATGQHREMLHQALEAFSLKPDRDLDIMEHGQSLARVTTRAIAGLEDAFEELRPAFVLAQGDTTTTFAAALAAFYRQVPFGHIEAGLRTETIWNPFPEEFNRRAASLVTQQHYAPTRWAAANLAAEGHSKETIFITGNTGIDAVQTVAPLLPQEWAPDHKGRVLLLTTHRRENWGEPQRQIAQAALSVVEAFPDTLLIVAMHRNPQVRKTLSGILSGHERVELIEPPDYARFVKLMQRSHLILSDSGGVQEEAPAFGIPVLVLRDTTERPEGVEAGVAKLVGTSGEAIIAAATDLLSSDTAYNSMAHAFSPYGDGKAAARIRFLVLRSLGLESPEVPMWT